MIKINNRIYIDDSEIVILMSKSSGPGGQNINKVNTRITLKWNIMNSTAFTPRDKERILVKLSNRIDSEGNLHVSSQDSRSALQNRQNAEKKLAQIIGDAIKIPVKRKPTQIPDQERQKRITEKKQRAQIKKLRQTSYEEE